MKPDAAEYKVLVIADAEDDLVQIYEYTARNDSPRKAQNLLRKLEEACLRLSQFPERGHTPPELERVGVREFKEIHLKPYRIVYQVMGRNVYIHCVLDSRRDLQDLLENRLLR